MPNVPGIRAGQPVTPPAASVMLVSTGLTEGNHDYFSSIKAGAVMRARVGDLLVVPGNQTRTGLVVGVVGQNGAPPYVIKWLTDGHIAMVTPDQYSRIVQAPDDAVQPRDGP